MMLPNRGLLVKDQRQLLLILLILFCLGYDAVAKEPWYMWMEAENFTSATTGISRMKEDNTTRRSTASENARKWFAERSGWDPELGQEISNHAYIEQMTGKRYDLSSNEQVYYRFNVPVEDDYYIWLRCDSPPPCIRQFSLWLDAPQRPNDALVRLNFSYWDIWSWWPWGGEHDTGCAKPIHLKKGPHILFIGAMSCGIRLDKILVTNNSQYQPFGISQQYYNGSFEPSTVVNYHNSSMKVTPAATGWTAMPLTQWEIKEDVYNHYYYVKPTIDGTLAYSLMSEMKCDCFQASYKIILPNGTANDAMLVYDFQDEQNYDSISLEGCNVKLRKVHQGKINIVATGKVVEKKTDKHSVLMEVVRLRTEVRVTVDGKPALQVRMASPRRGRIGLGSYLGGTGFDDIAIRPVNDPSADYDITKTDDPAWDDWVLVRSGKRQPWNPDEPMRRNDLLVYNVPLWTNSQVHMGLTPTTLHHFSVLYPFLDESHFVRTILDLSKTNTLQVERKVGTTVESLGQAALTGVTRDLMFQIGKGLFSISQNGREIVQANEYELLHGTIAFRVEEDGMIPLRDIKIIPNQIIVDNFDACNEGGVMPEWEIVNGSWITCSTLPSESGEPFMDKQLTINGPGTIRIGSPDWREYQIQLMAYVTSESSFSIDGWVDRDSAIQLYCGSDGVKMRRVTGDKIITLATSNLKTLLSGWHQFTVNYGHNGVRAQVDGIEIIDDQIGGFKGRAGLQNYHGSAKYDNVTIRIISTENNANKQVTVMDPLVYGIETELIR